MGMDRWGGFEKSNADLRASAALNTIILVTYKRRNYIL